MKRIWWIGLVLNAANAFALRTQRCEYQLAAPVETVVRALDFESVGSVQHRRLSPVIRAELTRVAHQRGVSVIPTDDGKFLGLAIDARPVAKDRGFLLRGELRGDVFHVTGLRDPAHEKRYYRRIAAIRGIESRLVNLDHDILDCRTLVLEGWAQVKLAMKHQLSVEDVAVILSSIRARPVWDNSPGIGRERYVIEDTDPTGRVHHVVIEEGKCPHQLITAFERSDPR